MKLVTGATGFIGRHLVHRLLERDTPVRALVLPGEALPPEWESEVEVIRGDVADEAAVARVLRGIETVYHLAAVVDDWAPEAAFQRVTVQGTENVLREAAAVGARALLVSSIVVYGHQLRSEVCDEERLHGRAQGPYSRAKQAQERIARRLQASDDLAVTIVRPANVYGPGSRPWVDQLVDHLRRGLPALLGRGPKNAGLVHVENIVEILLRAAETSAAVGRVYNAAEDSKVTWQRYLTDIAALADAPPPRTLPRPIAQAGAALSEPLWRLLRRTDRPPITREALNLVGSNLQIPATRARTELGYTPRVSYEQGLEGIREYLGAGGGQSSSPNSQRIRRHGLEEV